MVENFLLEYDKESTYALVKLIDAENMPYVVAFGYDTERRDWSQGHYYSKIEDAVAAYREAIDEKRSTHHLELTRCRRFSRIRLTSAFTSKRKARSTLLPNSIRSNTTCAIG